MNDNNELIKQYKNKFPTFGSYMECMSRALLSGLACMGLSKYIFMNYNGH